MELEFEDQMISILNNPYYFKEGEEIPPFPCNSLQYPLWLEIKQQYLSLNEIDCYDLKLYVNGIKSKKRKRKPENTIKKPATCYMLYCKAVRPLLKEQFPKHKNSDRTKLLAIMWNKLSKEEQDSWRLLAQEGKKFFEMAYPDYMPPTKKRKPYMTKKKKLEMEKEKKRMEKEKKKESEKQENLQPQLDTKSSFDLLFNNGTEENGLSL